MRDLRCHEQYPSSLVVCPTDATRLTHDGSVTDAVEDTLLDTLRADPARIKGWFGGRS